MVAKVGDARLIVLKPKFAIFTSDQ